MTRVAKPFSFRVMPREPPIKPMPMMVTVKSEGLNKRIKEVENQGGAAGAKKG
jgi:hypothetical protein